MQREESMFHDLPAVSYKQNTSPNGTGDNMVKTPDETTPRYAFRELARELDNLLNWAVEPWPNPLDEEWLEGTKRGIHHTARIALNATRDRVIADKVFAANCKGVEFARLLCNRPKLSTIPVEEWTIPKYRLLFDDLAALAREFHWLGQEVTETANEQPDASTPADGERAKKPTTINSRMLDILTAIAQYFRTSLGRVMIPPTEV